MAGLARFNMDLTPAGVGSKVEVNGEDVTDNLRAVTVRTAEGEVTKVLLEVFAARDTTRIQGEGVVYVETPGETPMPGEAALEFLRDLDPVELEKAILREGEGLGDGRGTGEMALAVLMRWAAGE